MPNEWRRRVVVHIYKNQGDKQSCTTIVSSGRGLPPPNTHTKKTDFLSSLAYGGGARNFSVRKHR